MIKRVVSKNFLSWKDMDITLPSGVTLIDGWNEDDQTSEGSGKSAVLNAICWALYGKIPKEANIDDVIKNGEKHCGVQVEFDHGVVCRSRGPNELLLFVGGIPKKGKDAKETQQLIEEFVGLTFETFCQTVYFAQNYSKKFITANQEEKGKILSEVQNLSLFDRAGKEVLALIKAEKDSLFQLEHTKALSLRDEELTKVNIKGEQIKHEHAKQQQTQRIQGLNNEIAAEEAVHRSAQDQQAKRIQDLKAQVAETERLIEDQETAKVQFKNTVAAQVYDEESEKKLQEANNLMMTEVGAVNAELSGIDRLVSKRMTAESQGRRHATRYKQLQTEREKNVAFIANPTKDCPTCGTKLEVCDTSHAQAEIDRVDVELAEITNVLTELSVEIDEPIPTKDELNAKLAWIRQQRATNDAAIQELRLVKEKVSKANQQIMMFDQNVRTYRTQLDKLRARIESEGRPLMLDTTKLDALRMRLEAECQPLVLDTALLDSLTVKLVDIRNSMGNLTRLIHDKTQHMGRLENLKVGFKEIKSHVFNSLLNELNARVQKYLGHLFEVPVVVRFTNEDMKIETRVKFAGVDRGLGLLSGGQARRVGLAVDLALSDVITSRKGARADLLILDEYFKDLSEASMEKCLALLEGRKQPVLLIEHNSIFKSIVSNSVFVKLENGTSRVETNAS